MRIQRSIAAATAVAALTVTVACNAAVDANPELHDTKGGYGSALEYPHADHVLDLPQSATIDSATAAETVRKRPGEPPAVEDGSRDAGH